MPVAITIVAGSQRSIECSFVGSETIHCCQIAEPNHRWPSHVGQVLTNLTFIVRLLQHVIQKVVCGCSIQHSKKNSCQLQILDVRKMEDVLICSNVHGRDCLRKVQPQMSKNHLSSSRSSPCCSLHPQDERQKTSLRVLSVFFSVPTETRKE